MHVNNSQSSNVFGRDHMYTTNKNNVIKHYFIKKNCADLQGSLSTAATSSASALIRERIIQ